MALTIEERVEKLEADLAAVQADINEIKALIIGMFDAKSYKTTLSLENKAILDKLRGGQ